MAKINSKEKNQVWDINDITSKSNPKEKIPNVIYLIVGFLLFICGTFGFFVYGAVLSFTGFDAPAKVTFFEGKLVPIILASCFLAGILLIRVWGINRKKIKNI